MDTAYDIYKALEQLSEMRAQAEVIRLHYEDLRKSIIPAEIQAQLDEIDAEQKTAADALSAGTSQLENEIKACILSIGATVKAGGLMAVWNKGRVSWDSKLLEGYAVAHPEILAARKEGDPSVTIRSNGK